MTKTSRLLATALAISLSTPAAAVTISTISFYDVASYHVLGPAEFPENFVSDISAVTLLSEPNRDGWEYFVDVTRFSPTLPSFGSGHIVASGCYVPNHQCNGEGGNRQFTASVGDVVLFHAFWFGSPYHPDIQLTFTLPDGVTLSQTPLPAAWLLFASVLGLGGLFRWLKRAPEKARLLLAGSV